MLYLTDFEPRHFLIQLREIRTGKDCLCAVGELALDFGKYIRGINLIASDVSGVRKYALYNAHGDVVQLTDSSGNVVKGYDYDAFGVLLEKSSPLMTHSATAATCTTRRPSSTTSTRVSTMLRSFASRGRIRT